jgi:hypothetical protein
LPFEAVLFDLDGTLIDSAPDLAGAANDLRDAHGCRRCRSNNCGRWSAPARAACWAPLRRRPRTMTSMPMKDRTSCAVRIALLRHTVFDAVVPVLDRIDAAGLPWGIVTNKALRWPTRSCTAWAEPDGRGGDRPATARLSPSRTPSPCSKPPAALGCRPAAAAPTWATTCATCRPAAPPAWPPWRAAWGYLGREPVEPGGPTPCGCQPIELLNWLELA